MKFLRRLAGGFSGEAGIDPVQDAPPEGTPDDPADADASEREHELDVLRAEQRAFDELTQRQLRYARYSWQPPSEGSERRADDHEEPAKDG